MDFNCYIGETVATLEIPKPLQSSINRTIGDKEGSFTMALFDNTWQNMLIGGMPVPQELNIQLSTNLGSDNHLQVRTCWGTPE